MTGEAEAASPDLSKPWKVVVPEYLRDRHLATLRRLLDVAHDPDLCTDRLRLLDSVG